ncbi:MAG: aldehyde dehydrogenase [Clostridiales bacterium]|nr:aldehyde dehydrogenase [Clostridiales bacterium]
MQVEALVAAQRAAQKKQPFISYAERAAALERLHKAIRAREKDILRALEQDLGKCEGEGFMTEVALVLDELKTARRHLKKWMRPRRVPGSLAQLPGHGVRVPEAYGLVLIMAPWNYPFQLTLSPLIGAVAAGNRCAVKPSAYAPATAQVMEEMLNACFDRTWVFTVQGGRAENQALLDQRFDYIFFTGGVAVGKVVLEKAARYVTPVTLELGGKSPCIVDETADIGLAARRIAFGKGLNSGQTCVAPDYVYAHRSVAEQLMAAIRDEWARSYGTDALHSAQWPHMVTRRHFDRVRGLIDTEKVFCGGQADEATLRIAPTILRNAGWDDPAMGEEIFGPVLPVMTFDRLDEVIDAVNSHEKPLALYLFTRSREAEKRVMTQVAFGGGCVNDTLIHLATSHMPFGGVGHSGMGSYHGAWSFDTFTHYKSVLRQKTRPDVPLRYPPFTPGKMRLMRRLFK